MENLYLSVKKQRNELIQILEDVTPENCLEEVQSLVDLKLVELLWEIQNLKELANSEELTPDW